MLTEILMFNIERKTLDKNFGNQQKSSTPAPQASPRNNQLEGDTYACLHLSQGRASV